jgi:hypothetical protein
MRDLTVTIAEIDGLLVTVARAAPLTSTIICKITNNFVETISALKQRDAGLFNTDPVVSASFGLGQWYTNLMGSGSATARLDKLADVVEGAAPPDGGVLTYNAADDKYYVREIQGLPTEADLDGGNF